MGVLVIVILVLVGLVVAFACLNVGMMVWSFGKFEKAAKHPIDFWLVPGHPMANVSEFQALGFEIVGALRAPSEGAPDSFTIFGYSPELQAFARVWVGNQGEAGPCSVKSRVRGGTLATTTAPAHPILPGSLEQGFPHASPSQLVGAHRSAIAFLHERGVALEPSAPEDWFSFFEEEWDAEAAVIRSYSFLQRLLLACRVQFRLGSGMGPLEHQRGIGARVASAPFA